MVCFLLTSAALANTNLSVWVFPGPGGRLIYQPDYLGNRILDASGVGYKGGTIPLPNSNTVPIKATISPVLGDNTANIQNAIDQVSALPLNTNGFRGAVLLNAGTYRCSSTIKISASGVVLRGVGSSTNGTGTVLQATANSQYTLVQITGSGSASTVGGTTHNITNQYVPVGARSFNVDSTANLSVGDHVFVRRVATSNWIHDIGMDLLTNPWTPDGYNVDMDRVITHLEANRIFVDAPITCAIDLHYTNGTIRKFTWSGRISNCGIEHIYGKSDYFGNSTNENHGWVFVQFNSIENGWARDLVSQYFGYACVALYSGTKAVTVADCQCLDPISIITGGRRYAFVMDDDTMCLVRNCYTRQDRHQFVTQSLTTGPNVFVDGVSDSAHAEAGPHHRWATAPFWDNVTVHGHDLDAQNTCESGTGHGWEGANCVIWNSQGNNLKVASPPGARNWLIGSIGTVSKGGDCYGIVSQPGTWDSSGPSGAGGTNVFPHSLYFAQLQDRLAMPSLQTHDYWLGEIDGFINNAPGGEIVPVDGAWLSAVQVAAGTQSLDGFDIVTNNHWVPFTFNFSLGSAERVVGATLSLSMRATNSAISDIFYVSSLTNSFSFSALNWLPVSTSPNASNATVRVVDLTAQVNLFTNGQLNLAVQGDIGVDWAMLELQVAPAINAGSYVLQPVADATVRGGVYAGNNFGTTDTLTVKNDSNSDNIRQAYLRWDLSGITQTVYQARVSLTPVSVGTNGIEQGVSVSQSNTWSETGITWNNQPGGGERFANYIPGTNAPVSFDVTPQVLDALASDKQLSLSVFSVRNVGSAGNVDYASREYSDANSRPRLSLTLLGAPPTISDITNRTIPANSSTGPIPFIIGDADSGASALVVGADSSNPTIAAQTNIVFGGSGSNRTVTVTPTANQSGAAVITVTVTDPSGLTAHDTFTLTVSSHSPSTIVWNGPGAGANNWSSGANWSPAEVPEAFDDVKFYDPGANSISVSNINNFVDTDFGGPIASLQYGNTNGNHTTLIGSGTLTISGTNGLIVGTETDNGTAQTVSSAITAPGGALLLNSPGGDLIVRQGTANSGGSQRATLDMSGLGNFTAIVDQILVGVLGPINRPAGTLYLGKTNSITATGFPGLCFGDSSSNPGGQNLLYLGQVNAIFADSITIARQKGTASLRFNPAFAGPAALFRGSDSSSRVSAWNIADNSLQSTSSSSALGTNDFSGGTVDAKVDTMTVGKSQKTTGANSIGVLMFGSGTMDVNTLQIGFQAQSGATSGGIGRVSVNGSNALLTVNTLLELGHSSGGGGTSNTFGVLNINGGTVQANSIAAGAGSGSNMIAMSNGTLIITNTAGMPTSPINTLAFTNSMVQLSPVIGSADLVAVRLITGGVSNALSIASLPPNASFPTQFTLITYSGPIGGAGYNFVLGTLPPGAVCGAYLSNNTANSSVDLVVTDCVVPDTFLTWDGSLSGDWDSDTPNWRNNVSLGLIYGDGDSVVFNDTASGATNINLTDTFAPGNITVSNSTKTFSFLDVGNLSGPMALTKQGAGTLLLANSGSNDFTGGAIISGGVLRIGNGGSNGNLPAGSVVDDATLAFNRSDSVTVPNIISGSGTLVQNGPGTLVLTGANSFSGGVIVAGGILQTANALALGASSGGTAITNGGTLDVNGMNLTAEPVTASGGGVNSNGAIVNAGPAQTSALRNLTMAGDVTLGGSSRWDIRAASSSSTNGCSLVTGGQPHKIIKVGTNQISLVAVSVDPGLGDIEVKEGVFAIQTVTSQVGDPNRSLTVFGGATLNLWDLHTAPLNKRLVLSNGASLWNESGNSTVIGSVLLTNGASTMNIGGASLTMSNNVISGVGGFTKMGSGTLNLRGVNTYSGSTVVSAGTLALVGSGTIANSSSITIASGATLDVTARSDGKLTSASGQTLSGNGVLYGSLLVSSNAVFSPGSSIGGLTVTNAATLQGTTFMELDAQSGTNDVIRGAQSISYGGGLLLTNISGALAAGQNFKLFYATNYSGAFANISPAIPALNLGWNTSTLTNDGTLRVVSAPTPQPRITSFSLSGGNLLFGGTNGVPGWTYYILTSTNPVLPIASWTRMATNQFSGDGSFAVTNALNLIARQQFFLLQLQ